MKNLLITLILLIVANLSALADILPTSTQSINHKTIGMYQIPKKFVLYENPDLKSNIKYEVLWNYKTFNATEGDIYNLFTVFVPQKELAFVQVVDFSEDWIEIIYNQQKGLTGWLKADDFRFLSLRNFYNLYGRKYGLYLFNDVKREIKELYSGTSEDSQVVWGLNKPKTIKLTAIRGNWALITALDTNNLGKTGYIKWRSTDGEIYLFPAIK